MTADHDSTWRDHAHEVGAVAVAEALGLSVRSRALSQCPACGDIKRGAKVFVGSDRVWLWKCHRCQEGGDMLDLVKRATACTFPEVQDWFASRGWCDPRPQARTPPVARVRPPVAVDAAPLEYPDRDQLQAFWRSLAPAQSDLEVVAWMEQRLGPHWRRAAHIPRALPAGAPCPPWARFGAASWADSGYRAIFAVFDHEGRCRSVRARRVVDGDGPKTVPPRGHACGRLVLAEPIAGRLLSGRPLPAGWPRVPAVVVCEGEVSMMAWATLGRYAVIGIGSGWWTQEHAERIPDGAEVLVATDHDANGHGDRYAAEIAATLAGRCNVRRWAGDVARVGAA